MNRLRTPGCLAVLLLAFGCGSDPAPKPPAKQPPQPVPPKKPDARNDYERGVALAERAAKNRKAALSLTAKKDFEAARRLCRSAEADVDKALKLLNAWRKENPGDSQVGEKIKSTTTLRHRIQILRRVVEPSKAITDPTAGN
jgi:hypothetical protein